MRLLLWLNAICTLVLLAAATAASAHDIFVTPIPGGLSQSRNEPVSVVSRA